MRQKVVFGFAVLLSTVHCGTTEDGASTEWLPDAGGSSGNDAGGAPTIDSGGKAGSDGGLDASLDDNQRAATQTSLATMFDGSASDRVYSVISTSDKGMVALGNTYSYGGGTLPNALVFKRDALGAPVWGYHLGTPTTNDQFFSGFEVADDLVMTGLSRTAPPNAEDRVLVVKLSKDGTWKWGSRFGAANKNQVTKAAAPFGADVLVAGNTSPGSAGKLDGYYARVDGSNGAVKWRRTMGGAGDDEILYARSLQGENAVVVGYTSVADVHNAWIAKIDGTGNVLWSRVLGGSKQEFRSVVERTDGSLVAVGNTDLGLLISEFSSTGTHLRSQIVASYGQGSTIQRTDTGLLIGGNTTSGTTDGKNDALIMKVASDVSGILWLNTYPNLGDDQLNRGGVVETSDHRILVGTWGTTSDAAAERTFLSVLKANGTHSGSCFMSSARTNATLSVHTPTVTDFTGASNVEVGSAVEQLTSAFAAPFTMPGSSCP